MVTSNGNFRWTLWETCNIPVTKYVTNCGKAAGTSNWTRNVETWSCATCKASTTYKVAVSSFNCTRCNTNHSIAASGAKSTTHKAVAQYTTCGY